MFEAPLRRGPKLVSVAYTPGYILGSGECAPSRPSGEVSTFDVARRRAISSKVLGMPCRRSRLGAAPVREYERAPPAALELFPGTVRLRKAVGDCIDDRRVMAQPAVAAVDLDILTHGTVRIETALPSADSVRATEYRRGGNRGNLGEARGHLIVGFAAVRPFVGTPGVGRLWRTGEGATEADHAANLIRSKLGKLASIEPAQAPTDEADPAAAMSRVKLLYERD